METITIKVDQELAKAYQEADRKKQENVNLVCQLILKEILQPSNFNQLVKEIREEASANGLTQEILEQLLLEDE
jgi:hypothetical protein